MTSLRQVKLERAKAYVLAHPDESKEEQAAGADLSVGTIATARAILIKDGVLTPSRKAPPPAPSRRSMPTELPTEGTPDKPASMLDHSALVAMTEMIDLAEGGDDDEVHRRLAAQCLRFAFDPKLHPDTRMSASQMWAKFRDQRAARALGPGAPMTFEAGVARLADLHQACGPKMVLAAVNAAFDVREADSAKAGDAPPAAGGTPPAAPAP